MDGSSPADLEEQMKQRSTRQYQQRWPGELSGCQHADPDRNKEESCYRKKKKKNKKTSQPLFTVSFIRKEKKKEKKRRKRQLKRWPGLRSMQRHFLVLLPWTPPCSSTCHALPFTHLSARPFLVRPEMTMGSKGSSVPEMVMPSGPLYLFNSTV